ncbi:hypothetical protein [Halomonas sp. GT]|uniref:hypothetical protein n=1 Tax=Halomonas sp. GT TaxID=1971364 RepID=UPI0009F2D431|nr:hypothetical protein [Halomonas sp. GT]
MKYQKVQKQLDEREKLRKFRELDDAFAQALRQLEDPNSDFDIPTGPPVRSIAALEADDHAADEAARSHEQDRLFDQRLKALIREFDLSERDVGEVIHALLESSKWTLDDVPVVSK